MVSSYLLYLQQNLMHNTHLERKASTSSYFICSCNQNGFIGCSGGTIITGIRLWCTTYSLTLPRMVLLTWLRPLDPITMKDAFALLDTLIISAPMLSWHDSRCVSYSNCNENNTYYVCWSEQGLHSIRQYTYIQGLINHAVSLSSKDNFNNIALRGVQCGITLIIL